MIMIFAGRREERCALHIAGHSGYARHGEDIVCAAVSTLANCLAAALTAFEQPGLHAKLRPGEAKITCTGNGVADVLFYAVVISLAQLAQKYPDRIQMRTEGYFRAQSKEEVI